MFDKLEISKNYSDRDNDDKRNFIEKHKINKLLNNSRSRRYWHNSIANTKDINDFSYSYISNFTSNPSDNNFLKTDRHQIPTFDQHTSVINTTMARYEFRKSNEESLIETTKIKDLKKGRKSHRFSQSLQPTTVLPRICENSEIKIFNYRQDFNNPEQSFQMLENNKNIYFEIKKNNLDRHEDLIRDKLGKMKFDKFYNSIKMPRLKILDISNKIKPIVRDERKINSIKLNNTGDSDNRIHKHMNEKANIISKFNLPMISISTSENLFHCSYKSSGKLFPEVRDQFAFHGDNSAIYMWGGINSNKSNNVWSLSGDRLEWTIHVSQNLPPFPRYGHTGLLYFKQFYILGGRAKENNYTFFPINLDIYNTEDHTWTSQAIFLNNGLTQRRNHVAEIIGNQIIIHGGMNENNEFLNDTLLLNFSPLKITPCNFNGDKQGPYLAGHSSALVIPSDIRNNIKFNIYRNLDNNVSKKSQQAIKEKGWYVFGGRTKESNITTNVLWILKIGRKNLEWFKPDINGKPPSPRWGHSMNYYEPRNFLIVHGGMNNLENDSLALDDTYILDLKKLEWKEIKLWSKKGNLVVQKRYGHQAQINCKLIKLTIFSFNYSDNKLIIFGGMNCYNYVGSSLFVIDLEYS